MVNIADAIIILFILMCTITGMRRGGIRETVNVIGNFLIIIISFKAMGGVASLLYKFMPFLSMGLLGISLSALNILVYQIIAFTIVYLILSVLFRLVLVATRVVDKIISSLILFNGLSSLLGAVVGFLGGYIMTFVILVVISVPLADASFLHDSKLNQFILQKTPILTGLTTPISSATHDIYQVTTKISKDANKFENSAIYNAEILDIMLKYQAVSVETVDSLVEQGKLKDIQNVEGILKKYR